VATVSSTTAPAGSPVANNAGDRELALPRKLMKSPVGRPGRSSVTISAHVVATLSMTLDRYVDQRHNINVEVTALAAARVLGAVMLRRSDR
jgi:hypothetical protein